MLSPTTEVTRFILLNLIPRQVIAKVKTGRTGGGLAMDYQPDADHKPAERFPDSFGKGVQPWI
jgi:hypothetical protein